MIGLLYLVGALGTGLVSNLPLFQIFRFLGGVGVGVGVRGGADLHDRDRPATGPGPARRLGPVQHRARHPAGLPVELHRRTAAGGHRLALDVPRDGVPAAIFFLLVFTIPRRRAGSSRSAAATRPSRSSSHASSREEADFEIREIEEALAAQHGQTKVPFFPCARTAR